MAKKLLLWLVVCLLLIMQTAVTFGQMSDEQIAEMQERAKKEGWTFIVGRNAATDRPVKFLCGVLPFDPNDPLLRAKLDEAGGGIVTGGWESLPISFDWRDEGMVTEIKDQSKTIVKLSKTRDSHLLKFR